MKHFYFSEENSGEEFIVGADTLEEATIKAEQIAADIASGMEEEPELLYWYEMSEEEAESSGLDEY